LTDFAATNGYTCIEVCCWPLGKAERRYAGVTHIDVDTLTGNEAESIISSMKQKGVEISALGYYPNPLDPDRERASFFIAHIKKVIDAATMLGLKNINTFVGRDKNLSVDKNLEKFAEVWPSIINYAESKGIRIGIENCPMIFTDDEWPGGNNLATTPAIWRKLFSIAGSDNFGLNFDPSHLLWQQMDYVKPLYEFREKIFHVHLKDAKVDRDKLNDVGIMATPLQFHIPKLPGLGDIDWGRFISALNDIRYKGAVCVEVEDKSFEGSVDERKYSLQIARRFLSQYL
jgi:sugar phosphate isomerase/epimerase